MLRKRILALFSKEEKPVQEVIRRVLDEEQRLISYENPKGIKEKIREIIEDEAKKK